MIESNCFIDCPITIEDYLILDNLKSCFVFQNKPNVTLFDNDENDRPFNLKQYLLGLKIIHHVLDSAFYFIFDVGNPSHLAIKAPRKSLENDELPNTKKNIFNGLIKTIYGCIDDENAFLELENDKTINDLNLQDLLGQLKTQAFPLSDIITNAINQKEGVALDYAPINDIKYNLLDNTFHFIFDIDLHLIDD